jgi:multidrug resistance protein, MATE family
MFDGPSMSSALWRKELRATVALALPLIGTQLAQISTMTTDVVLLGRLSAEALAAGALGANVVYVLITFTMGVLMAVSPMVAQARGRKRHSVRDVRRSVRQGFWAAVAIGVPCMIVIWHTEPLLMALGQSRTNAAGAAGYAHAMLWGFLPGAGFMLLRFFVAALGRPAAGLVVMLLAVLLNAVLAWALIFGRLGLPGLGVVGAGVATSIANVFSFAVLLGFVLADRRFRRFYILGRFWRPDWHRLRELFRVGLPIGCILLLEVGLFSAAVQLMGLLGTAEIAAHQIALQCAAIAFMVPLGIGQAATVRVGLAAGRRDAAAVQRAGWVALALGVGFMSGTALLMWLMPHALVGLFLDLERPENARVVALAVAFLGLAALFQIFDGVQTIALGALRGLKDTRVPAMLAATGYWLIGFPVSALLAFRAGMGGVGVWYGLALGLAAVAVLALHRFVRRERLGLVPRAC